MASKNNNGRLNEFNYGGEVTGIRPANRKDGSAFGKNIAVAQMGEKLEFLVDNGAFESLKLGDYVIVTGHMEQQGYNLRLRVGNIIVQDAATAAA